MSDNTGRKYYYQCFKDRNLEIPTQKCTQDQIDVLVENIVDNKMTLRAASKKANMCEYTGRKYYREYLKDRRLAIPIPKTNTQDQINKLIHYIVVDKMTKKAAAKKANMGLTACYKYYLQYRKEHNIAVPIPKRITQDQIDNSSVLIKVWDI